MCCMLYVVAMCVVLCVVLYSRQTDLYVVHSGDCDDDGLEMSGSGGNGCCRCVVLCVVVIVFMRDRPLCGTLVMVMLVRDGLCDIVLSFCVMLCDIVLVCVTV